MTEPKPNRRVENKAKTRRKILEAAATLLMSHPSADVGMRDIAAEAGLSTGAIFANFSGREQLIMEVAGERADVRSKLITEHLAAVERLANAGADEASEGLVGRIAGHLDAIRSQVRGQ